MNAAPKPTFSDTDRLMQMSLILKAIDDSNQELTEYKATHKARLETLHGELAKLRWEVLSGQERLPLEPPQHLAVPVIPISVSAETAETVNHSPAAESSVEERARTRKAKTKLAGQDALIPPVETERPTP